MTRPHPGGKTARAKGPVPGGSAHTHRPVPHPGIARATYGRRIRAAYGRRASEPHRARVRTAQEHASERHKSTHQNRTRAKGVPLSTQQVIEWTEDGRTRTAHWRSENGAPPPRRIEVADDRMPALHRPPPRLRGHRAAVARRLPGRPSAAGGAGPPDRPRTAPGQGAAGPGGVTGRGVPPAPPGPVPAGPAAGHAAGAAGRGLRYPAAPGAGRTAGVRRGVRPGERAPVGGLAVGVARADRRASVAP